MIKDGPDYSCAYHEYHEGKQNNGLTDQQFAVFIRAMLVSEFGYVMDVGNNENANFAIAKDLLNKVRKRERTWKSKFMVG